MSDFASFTGAIEAALRLTKGGNFKITVGPERNIPGMLLWRITEIER